LAGACPSSAVLTMALMMNTVRARFHMALASLRWGDHGECQIISAFYNRVSTALSSIASQIEVRSLMHNIILRSWL